MVDPPGRIPLGVETNTFVIIERGRPLAFGVRFGILLFYWRSNEGLEASDPALNQTV